MDLAVLAGVDGRDPYQPVAGLALAEDFGQSWSIVVVYLEGDADGRGVGVFRFANLSVSVSPMLSAVVAAWKQFHLLLSCLSFKEMPCPSV